jgi:hypothetical protein
MQVTCGAPLNYRLRRKMIVLQANVVPGYLDFEQPARGLDRYSTVISFNYIDHIVYIHYVLQSVHVLSRLRISGGAMYIHGGMLMRPEGPREGREGQQAPSPPARNLARKLCCKRVFVIFQNNF